MGRKPQYIAPEVARAILAGNNEQQQHYQFKPTVAIDVFSFALWVFEVFNHQVSLWEQLGATDITNDQEVLVIASQLTDEQIDRVIYKRLSDQNSTSARHWLQNALRVDPNDRLSIDQLDAKHSLFTIKYATINMDTIFTASKENTERIITVINTNTQQIIDNNNTNVTAVMNNFQEL